MDRDNQAKIDEARRIISYTRSRRKAIQYKIDELETELEELELVRSDAARLLGASK